MRLDLLADALEEADLGVVGETIFVDAMPADATTAILLRVTLTGIPVDHELPGYHRGRIQAIIRAPNTAIGAPLAQQVFDTLRTEQRVEYTDEDDNLAMTVLQMLPDTLPLRFPRSDGGGIEWSINFDCTFVLP